MLSCVKRHCGIHVPISILAKVDNICDTVQRNGDGNIDSLISSVSASVYALAYLFKALHAFLLGS